MAIKLNTDININHASAQFAATLRRFADGLESGRRFRIRVAGEGIVVPEDASFNIAHTRQGQVEEIEFQIKWRNDACPIRL